MDFGASFVMIRAHRDLPGLEGAQGPTARDVFTTPITVVGRERSFAPAVVEPEAMARLKHGMTV